MHYTVPFTIYDASAGSGKTFTLVRNYIADLLTDKTHFRNVLAITFTNKAVAEMKERIIENLRGLSQKPTSKTQRDFHSEIKKITGLDSLEIQKKAGQILKEILHNYAAFEVSTIDSFTHRILQIFAKDLNLPINFEVQLEQEEILQEAVDRIIAKAGSDAKLTQALLDFSLAKTDEDKSWDITYDLNKIAKLIVDESNFEALQILHEYSLDDFKTFENNLKKHIVLQSEFRIKIGDQFFKLIQEKGAELERDFNYHLINYFRKLHNGKNPKPSTSKWAKEADSAQLYKAKTSTASKEIIDQLQPVIHDLYKASELAYYQIAFFQKILNNNSSTSLLSEIEKEVEKIKSERDLILISEFNKKIQESIQGQPVPFIYERLGERFQTFYIDEFQDTSELQWENLKPLIANSLAGESGKLTLVGDAKQSIYRWRGGKAEQFMDLSADENPFYTDKHLERLPNNYRSRTEIVNFNNSFYQFAAAYLQVPSYRSLFETAHQTPIKEAGGLIDIRFIEAANREEEDEIYPEEVYAILEELKEKYPDDYPIYKDICVLVRNNKQAIYIADFLTENKIPIISSESLLLKKSAKVSFLIDLLHFSLRPNDKNLKFNLLNFIYQNQETDRSHFQFIKPKLAFDGSDFFNALKEIDIHFNLQVFEQLPLYDAVEYSLRQFRLTHTQDAYIQFFLDFVYDYSQRKMGGVSGFLETWELKQKKLSITSSTGSNAVQIMTVHKAKGLEFPIVILPYAQEKVNDTRKDSLWITLDKEPNTLPIAHITVSQEMIHYNEDAQKKYTQLLYEKEMDAMNLLYVATTRPKEQLYILSKLDLSEAKKEQPKTWSAWLINYLKHKNLWEEEKVHYQWGELEIPDSYEPLIPSTEELAEEFISSSPSEHQIRIVTKSGQLWNSPQEKAIEKGNLIHELLKHIKTYKDLDSALTEAVWNGAILAKEKKSYKKTMEEVVFHQDLQAYFTEEYKVYTEKEILIQGNYLRLDRLCIQNEEAVIIDYKTGAASPSHKLQINEYANAIQHLGYTVKKKILVYINNEVQLERVE